MIPPATLAAVLLRNWPSQAPLRSAGLTPPDSWPVSWLQPGTERSRPVAASRASRISLRGRDGMRRYSSLEFSSGSGGLHIYLDPTGTRRPSALRTRAGHEQLRIGRLVSDRVPRGRESCASCTLTRACTAAKISLSTRRSTQMTTGAPSNAIPAISGLQGLRRSPLADSARSPTRCLPERRLRCYPFRAMTLCRAARRRPCS